MSEHLLLDENVDTIECEHGVIVFGVDAVECEECFEEWDAQGAVR